MSQTENSSSKTFYVIENHPQDSRAKICEDDTFQTLSSRMGTGGIMYRWLWRIMQMEAYKARREVME